MNKVILQGRLTRDVELSYTKSSLARATFSLAVSRRFKREGEPDADFINCVAFGKIAENISRFFSKGRMILIDGHIQCGSYTNKNGVKIPTTNIMLENFYFTGEKKQEQKVTEGSGVSSDFFAYDETVEDADLLF